MSFEKAKWCEIRVGDLVRVKNKEVRSIMINIFNIQFIPADIIVLISSEKNGVSYCSTSSLDGERALKPK